MTGAMLHAGVGAFGLVVLGALLLAAWRAVLAVVGEQRSSVAAAFALGSVAVVDVPGGIVGGVGGGVAILVVVAALAWRMCRCRPATAANAAPTTWSSSERLAAAVLGGLLIWCALGSWMWDERSTHLPLAGAFARGVVPLEHPLFPGQVLHYHPGYAVVVGVVRWATGLPLDVCADIVTVAGIAVLLHVLRDALVGVGGPRAGAIGLLLVWCCGGPLAGILADGWGVALPFKAFLPSSWVNGATFPPLVVTNILQHPQGLAMPMAAAAVALLTAPRTTGRVVVVAVAVIVMSRIQILFSAFTGLLLVGVVVGDALVERAASTTRRAAVIRLVVCAGAAVTALRLGGISVGDGGALIGGAGYFARDGLAAVLHEVLAFGLSLAAVPAAVVVARHRPASMRALIVALAIVGGVGFVVGNVAIYARSWDIVKFFGVSMFFGHIVVTLAVVRLPRWAQVVVVVVSCWSGLLWLARHGPLQGIIAAPAREQPLDAVAVALDDACGPLVAGRARVLSARLELGQVGWLVPGTDWRRSRDTAALLIDRVIAERDDALRTSALKDLNNDDIAALDVDVVVVDTGMERRLRTILQSDRFQLLCRAKRVAVYRVRHAH